MNTKYEIIQNIRFLFDDKQPDIDTLRLNIDPDKRTLTDASNIQYDTPQLQMDQLRHVSSIVNQIETTVSSPSDIIFPEDEPFTDHELLFFSSQSPEVINKITSKSKITRRKLKMGTPEYWTEWKQAEKKILDDYETQNMYGKPILRPRDSIVMRSLWTYIVKG